ncbi:MAG: hypothetical protein FWG21_02775, partial [Oscillospiraceae bacterium]|nr:hypothetical protein [Oscillospiraceae bacterium]
MATNTSSAAKNRKTRADTAKALQEERMRKRQFRNVVLFAFSLFLMAVAFIEGQNLWLFLHNLLFGISGILAYCFGIILLLITLMLAYNRKPQKMQVFFIILLSVSFCGAFLVFGNINIDKFGFFEGIVRLYTHGVEKSGGGLFSALLGWPLYLMFGRTGAKITIVLLIFVCMMAIMRKGLYDLIESIRKPVSSQINKKREERELLEQIGESPATEENTNKTKPSID